MKGADYYGEVFAIRETGPVIPASSGVWVELRTNVIVSIFLIFSLPLLRVLAPPSLYFVFLFFVQLAYYCTYCTYFCTSASSISHFMRCL